MANRSKNNKTETNKVKIGNGMMLCNNFVT